MNLEEGKRFRARHSPTPAAGGRSLCTATGLACSAFASLSCRVPPTGGVAANMLRRRRGGDAADCRVTMCARNVVPTLAKQLPTEQPARNRLVRR